MPDTLTPPLFEACCTPRDSLGRRGMWWVVGVLALGSALSGGLFLLLGAWPIIGFTGGETLLVLALLALHRRRGGRAREELRLAAGRLQLLRVDGQGRHQSLSLDPYWTRLQLEERPGRIPALWLRQRGQAIEIAALLGEAEKRALAEALGAALRHYREPVFDNPQL
jgi:uncharacterized membrane protein